MSGKGIDTTAGFARTVRGSGPGLLLAHEIGRAHV